MSTNSALRHPFACDTVAWMSIVHYAVLAGLPFAAWMIYRDCKRDGRMIALYCFMAIFAVVLGMVSVIGKVKGWW